MWDKYETMEQAMSKLPNGSEKEAEYAVPDVYGKAIRLYNALYESYRKGRNSTNSEEVLLWRGLITLLALQDHLRFPLSWEKVSMPARGETNNLFDDALHAISKDAGSFLLNPQEAHWNGVDFYVLKWTTPEQREFDLLLFSPLTMVYPVADWRKIFTKIGKIKWFDRHEQAFLPPETKLNDCEKEIVAFWLERISKTLNVINATEVQTVVKSQVDRYIADLGVNLTAADRACLSPIGIEGSDAAPRELPQMLRETVRMTVANLKTLNGQPAVANALFSDQICYFQSNKNLFVNCRNPDNYSIGFQNLYAFLPIHPDLRQNDLSQNVTMNAIQTDEGWIIRAKLVTGGKKYEQDYMFSTEYSARRGVAVPYKPSMLDESNAPFVSVWPNEVNKTWNEFYIMVDDSQCESGNLRIADAEQGSNKYVSKMSDVPSAIPIIRQYKNGGQASVGIINPVLVSAPNQQATVTAVVAVDFGTSSTRVFAAIEENIEEISAMDDEPLGLTKFGLEREFLMRDHFIPPCSITNDLNTLFSIYRRSDQSFRNPVRPLLDGVIFQQSSQKIVEAVEESEKLMPNLKWDVRKSKGYYIAFMKQLLFHVVCLLNKKGVNSIRWKYALPESMDVDSRATVHGIWKNELEPYLQNISGRIQHMIDGSLSESEAASRYFLFHGDNAVHARKGYLVVDIGGGSTDIALWQGEGTNVHMKWHTSVNVAGRKMFTRWIEENLEPIFENLKDGSDKIAGQLFLIDKVTDPSLRLSLIEMLLNANYNELLENYRQECRDTSESWGITLRTRINQAVSLLMFALGCQVGAMISEGKFSIPDDPLGAFVIAFGGRGANILEWRGYSEDYLAKAFCAGAEARGAKIDSDIRIEISGDVKCEVARGLLISRPPESSKAMASAGAPLSTADYVRITEAFQTMFRQHFQRGSNGIAAPPEIDRNVLAARLESYESDKSQIINVMMEVIYENLAK